ncbi:MAG: hypothetical protein ACYCTI_13530 [Acidimicrobiales bacterium]
MRIGEETFELNGALGLRDHWWGPRYWQAVWRYRSLTVNLGPDLGLATTIAGTEGGDRHVHGFLYDSKRYGDDRRGRSAMSSCHRTTTTPGTSTGYAPS